MTRITLTDDSAKWFNQDSSVDFKEDTWWNGNNNISVATGSQWDHECLYYTKSGNWILNSWSQMQESKETYITITEEVAIEWLIKNSHFDQPDELPEQVRKRVQTKISESEL